MIFYHDDLSVLVEERVRAASLSSGFILVMQYADAIGGSPSAFTDASE